MKNIFIITVCILTVFQFSNAQVIPPTPPSTTSSSSSSTSTTTVDNGDTNESTSISISHTDEDYKLRARFPNNREAKLKTLIQNSLGDKNLDIRKGYSKWSNDKKVYEIKLTETTLRIWLDLTVASPDLVKKFEALGNDAKTIISGSTANAEKDRMQREAERMRREADRMQQEAKRLEEQVVRDAKRIERDAKRIERDAKRIEVEAKRLDIEAKRVEEEARHKGGVSTYVKRLLADEKTIYTATSGTNLNWIWPEVQENLLKSLLSDNLIVSTSEVTFTLEKDRMYANGVELSETQNRKYSAMFRKAGIQTNADFSFYKKDNHIVVIGLNAKIKKVFNDLYKKGLITSKNEPVKLLIDGNSVTQNGKKLSSADVAAYNAILRDNAVIPAPGKYIEMTKTGSYRLGYSLGNKGHIGTWIQED